MVIYHTNATGKNGSLEILIVKYLLDINVTPFIQIISVHRQDTSLFILWHSDLLLPTAVKALKAMELLQGIDMHHEIFASFFRNVMSKKKKLLAVII